MCQEQQTIVSPRSRKKPLQGEINQEGRAHEKEGGDETETEAEAEVAADEAANEGGGDQADKKVVEDEEHGNQTEVRAVEDDRCGDRAEAEAAEEEENRNQPEEETKRQRTACEFCQRKSEEINRLLQENGELRCELDKSKMDEDFLKGNTDKVRYYTGIP